MNNITTISLLFFILFATTYGFSQTDDKDVSIIASGSGKTQDDAKQSALRSAIEQAFGAFISSKTEILNDSLVKDEIVSVANGNIKSFEILNESQLPDGIWGITLRAFVSINKLISFVEAKGITIEIKGGLFASNVKQQLLNEQGEYIALCEMVGILHEPLQISFDYEIKSGDPKSLDDESINWGIPLFVKAIANENMDFCANYCINTLAALSLSPEEVLSYKSLNKGVFPVFIKYNGVTHTFYLRKQKSINILNTLISNWEFYTRLFTVQSGMDELNGYGSGWIHSFCKYSSESKGLVIPTINFLSSSQEAARFSWEDKWTLSQIEQLTGYTIKPRGVVSKFKLGGFVVYEENGHGLITAITDLKPLNWNSAKMACDELILNGYSDWHLPKKEELDSVFLNLVLKNKIHHQVIGYHFGDLVGIYWSSSEVSSDFYTGENLPNAWAQQLNVCEDCYESESKKNNISKINILCVRAVRNF